MNKIITTFMAGTAAIGALAWTALAPQGSPAVAAAVNIPGPASDVPAVSGNQVAIFAGGCFWGVEAVFQHVDGVRSAVSGYAGGSAADADYGRVSAGATDHAEVVRIVYDPSEVSYGLLLQIYFSVAHDPTQVNRQGPDTGRQYRSAIFPQNAEQRRVAQAYIAQLGGSGRFSRPIATTLETGRFNEAEEHHQNFMSRNPRHPYILAHDVAKVRDFRRAFASDFSERPAG